MHVQGIKLFRKIEKSSKILKSGYMDSRFLLPTSNMVERFFSLTGFTLTDYRQRLTPANFEMQLFLKLNRKVWDQELVSEVCASVKH